MLKKGTPNTYATYNKERKKKEIPAFFFLEEPLDDEVDEDVGVVADAAAADVFHLLQVSILTS